MKLTEIGNLLLLPVLVAAYIQTGNMGIYYVLATFIWLVFFTCALALLASFYVKLPAEKLFEIRAQIRKTAVRRMFSNVLMGVLIIVLFVYVNSMIGTLYLMSVVMILLMRARVMTGRIR